MADELRGRPGDLEFALTGSAQSIGFAALYLGFPGLDASGCGLMLPGLGELLLSLETFPALLQVSLIAGGEAPFAPLLVPANPSLLGVQAHFQAAVMTVSLVPVSFSTALAVLLGS